MPALRFRLKTCSRNGWRWAEKSAPSTVVPRADPQNAPSALVPVRHERFRWIRAWVASSSASAAALARPHSWRRSLIDPFFAFFNNPPVADGFDSAASAISSAWSSESSPLRRASSTSGWSLSFFAVSTVRLALPFEVPVFLARSSAALAPWFSANRAARRSFNDVLARSFLITTSNNASAACADSASTRRSRASSSVPAQSSFAASNTSASPAANLIGPLCATPLTENAGTKASETDHGSLTNVGDPWNHPPLAPLPPPRAPRPARRRATPSSPSARSAEATCGPSTRTTAVRAAGGATPAATDGVRQRPSRGHGVVAETGRPADLTCVPTISCIELPQDVGDVHAGGLLRDEQLIGDLAIRPPVDEELEHLRFPSGEPQVAGRSSARARVGSGGIVERDAG